MSNKNEKKKKLSRRRFLIITISCYVLFFLLCKFFMLFSLDVFSNYGLLDKTYSNSQTIKFDVNNKCDGNFIINKKFPINTIKVDGYEEAYHVKEEGFEIYSYIPSEDNSGKIVINIGTTKSHYNMINEYDESSVYFPLNYFPVYVSEISKKYFLNKHDIKNDVDLYRYIREREKKTSSMFTSIMDIKERYFFYLVENNLPEIKYIRFFDGNVEGFMQETDNGKYYSFINKDGDISFIHFVNIDSSIEDTMINNLVLN